MVASGNMFNEFHQRWNGIAIQGRMVETYEDEPSICWLDLDYSALVRRGVSEEKACSYAHLYAEHFMTSLSQVTDKGDFLPSVYEPGDDMPHTLSIDLHNTLNIPSGNFMRWLLPELCTQAHLQTVHALEQEEARFNEPVKKASSTPQKGRNL